MAGPEHTHGKGALSAQDHTWELSVIGYAGCVLQLSGTWTGTVTFKGSENGTDFDVIAALPLSEATGVVTTATANGHWRLAVDGLARIQAKFTTFGSGTVVVSARATVGGVGPMTPGSGGGGGGASTIADGADATQGLIADVAVVGDVAGTLSAKLRGLSKILNDVWDSVNHWFKVSIQNATLAVTQSGSWVLSAGSAAIGKVDVTSIIGGWKIDYAASAQLALGSASLASSATFVAGRESNAFDNTTTKYPSVAVSGFATTGTTPTAGELRWYLVPMLDDSTWPDVFDGTDSAETVTSVAILQACGVLLAAIPADTTSDRTYAFYARNVAALLGWMPKKFVIYHTHSTVAALNATAGNHKVFVTPQLG